jgi:predicted HAD superfamily phosphohydrolase YqeG
VYGLFFDTKYDPENFKNQKICLVLDLDSTLIDATTSNSTEEYFQIYTGGAMGQT